MKRQTGAEQNRNKPAEELTQGPVGDDEQAATSPLVHLSEEQKTVFDCLQKAETGLTQRQIVLRVSCSEPAVEEAIAGLLALNLVGRLNTLVPSYACKYPGVRIYND